jgi:hypothetical protein
MWQSTSIARALSQKSTSWRRRFSLLLGERRVKRAVIRVAIVRPHILRLWALPYPDSDGRTNNWRSTAWDVANLAERLWVMFEMNPSGTGWDAMVAATQ